MKFKLKTIATLLAAVGLMANTVEAAPFLNLSILASTTQGGTYTSALNGLTNGQTVYVEVVGKVAPVGTTNSTGTGKTITSLTANDGVSSLKFDLTSVGAPTWVTEALAKSSTTPPATVDWSSGNGSSAGVVTGSNVNAIRPTINGADAATATAANGDVIWIGSLTVSANATLNGNWTSGGSGSVKVNNGSSTFITSTTEGGADPYVKFNGANLNLSAANALVAISAASGGAPTTYGASQGTLTVTGSNGKYAPAYKTLSPAIDTGYVEVKTFTPATDQERIYLNLVYKTGAQAGQQLASADLSKVITDINAISGLGGTASTVPGADAPFFPGYNLLLAVNSPPSGDNFYGFDFTQETGVTGGVQLAAVAAVPEPVSISILGLGCVGLLARRRRQHA